SKRSGLRLFTYGEGMGSRMDSTTCRPIPAEPETPCALHPPAITKPLTRELSPTMKRPSGVNVGQPLNTLRIPNCSTAGISGPNCCANQPKTSQSDSIGGGFVPSEKLRGSAERPFGSQPPHKSE